MGAVRCGVFSYGKRYASDFFTLDIETSRVEINGEVQAIPYLWQMTVFNGRVSTGRNFKSMIRLLEGVNKMIEPDKRLVIYVFNLAYEFQFLRGYLNFESDDVFCLKPRAVLYAKYKNIEFRCAYRLTNMSLDKFTRSMDVEHKKLSGEEFNYNIVRYPWTELTSKEKEYAINDVLGLYEAIHTLMEIEGDTLDTIPFTSTGYVRRRLKDSMRGNVYILQKSFPDIELYNLLRKAFRGGDTHASRYYAGILLSDVSSCDRVSSYIEVMFNYKYPYNLKYYDGVDIELAESLIDRKYALLMSIKLNGVCVKAEVSSPYIPYAKTDLCVNSVKDNGRILSADVIIMTVTDIDYEIIKDTYNIDSIEILRCYVGNYRKLPAPILNSAKELYKEKCELKGIPGKESDYILSKERLNAIFGDMVQNILKDDIIYTGGEDPFELREADINKFYAQGKHPYKLYQWGVWITAYARRELYYLARKIGLDFVYSDTDSIKYCGDHDKDIDEYNDWKRKQCEKNGAYYDLNKNGVVNRFYLGVYDKEGCSNKFITFGAKKYASEDALGNVSITISGVDKKKGAKEVEECGGIEALQEGFVFREGGGSRIVYNDEIGVKEIEIDGHTLEYSTNAVILPDEYTLHLEHDYSRLLKLSRDTLKSLLASVGKQIDAERKYK